MYLTQCIALPLLIQISSVPVDLDLDAKSTNSPPSDGWSGILLISVYLVYRIQTEIRLLVSTP
jgi:hypothetical protein